MNFIYFGELLYFLDIITNTLSPGADLQGGKGGNCFPAVEPCPPIAASQLLCPSLS